MAGIDYKNVKFEGTYDSDILLCIKTILTTFKGSVPFDRDFGIDIGMIDENIHVAQNKYTVEAIKAIRKYEDRVKIKSIEFEVDISGMLKPKVTLEVVE